MTTMPPFLNIANVGNSKIPDSQMMQVFNFFPCGFRLGYQVSSCASICILHMHVLQLFTSSMIAFSSILTMFLSDLLIRSGHQQDSNLIKLVVHCLQLNGKPIKNSTLYNKVKNLSFFTLHLGKDSVTIIIFLVALPTEEYSNKSKNRNTNISWWQLSIQQWFLKGLVISQKFLSAKSAYDENWLIWENLLMVPDQVWIKIDSYWLYWENLLVVLDQVAENLVSHLFHHCWRLVSEKQMNNLKCRLNFFPNTL